VRRLSGVGQTSERMQYNPAEQVVYGQTTVNRGGVVRTFTAAWQYDRSLTTQADYPHVWVGAG
jgi:hypothetical protein